MHTENTLHLRVFVKCSGTVEGQAELVVEVEAMSNPGRQSAGQINSRGIRRKDSRGQAVGQEASNTAKPEVLNRAKKLDRGSKG